MKTRSSTSVRFLCAVCLPMWAVAPGTYAQTPARLGIQTNAGLSSTGAVGTVPLQQGQRGTNSLGMVFASVKGTEALFCIWETRVKDFEAFIKATGHDMGDKLDMCFNSELKLDEWKGYNWKKPGFEQGPNHPVVGANWEDAQAFCKWLTEKERKERILAAGQAYRLPTDAEWSAAVGLEKESVSTPEEQRKKAESTYPWGTGWPPPKGAGNYADTTTKQKYRDKEFTTIEGYDDGYAETAPVGSFNPNAYGLYDMGGNVWEWCSGWPLSDGRKVPALRGSSWFFADPASLHSSYHINPASLDARASFFGFRVVLAPGQP
jgi:formylglycine-generating enzyme required for sulfatase activity